MLINVGKEKKWGRGRPDYECHQGSKGSGFHRSEEMKIQRTFWIRKWASFLNMLIGMPWCGQQNIKIIRLWNFSGTRERQKCCNYKNNFLLINCFWLEWATGIVLGAMWARRETAFCSLHTCILIRWLASLWQAAALPSQSSGRSLTPGPAVCVDLWPQGSQGRGNKNWPVI